MECVEVWGPPTSLAGRAFQIVFLSTLLGAVPLAIAALVLLRITRGKRSSDRWVRLSRIGVLLQVCVLSSLVVGALFLSEVEFKTMPGERDGPVGLVLMFVCVNLTAAVAGLRAWRALGISSSRAGSSGAG